ncbi:MAG: ABC transporter permease [Clostridia bacterium]|nr:ABC transporter permease [Clostridia bacterium]
MPKKSRTKRFIEWIVTLCLSIGAVLYPRNIKNAFRSVTKNWKEYVCFYLAALVMTAGFWTVALCAEANMHKAKQAVAEEFDYHIEVALLDNEQYANLDQQLQYQLQRENEYLADYYWVNDGKPLLDGTYSCRILLDTTLGMEDAYLEVLTDILNRVTAGRRDIRFSPLYTFDADYGIPYTVQLWTVSLVWLAFSILIMAVLFLIRLDHFKFIYGIYMTCGADFTTLMGAAGGELLVITVLTWLPATLIGVGIAAALYIPQGVGLWFSMATVLIPLLGGLIAVISSVWFPMRKMSKQPPVRHLQAGDNTNLVSSPRRSFFLFGEDFPGKYELYGFWRMRKYYLRLVLSAILFAAFFISGLYIAELETYHSELDPFEYVVAYRPANYYEEAETEEGEIIGDEPWVPTDDQADMIRSDVDLFLEDVEAVPGVSHAEWEVGLSGGFAQSHLLLKSGQLYDAGSYTVTSKERASEGFQWAVNNYVYTVTDQLWIDNMLKHELATFEGDPYAVLTTPNGVIISEDVYNKKTYDFQPGDKIVVAIFEEVQGGIEMVFDPRELLRQQIDNFKFRYETFTVCAVVSGLNSEAGITFGVTDATYTALTGRPSSRTELKIYMEKGTDLDTVRAAEGQLRKAVSSFSDWLVTPTGNYFETGIKSLKNDNAVVLTLAVCLLLISPMVWYFSQIMFYRKRRNEFAVLHALGAPDDAFAKIHRLAGGILSGAAFLTTVLLSLLCNYLVYFTVTTLLPKLHLTESIHYEFHLSIPALIACVLISVLCGFMSCELPYRMYTKPDIGVRRVD